MEWSQLAWQIPLGERPTLRAVNLAVHGQPGRLETYRLPDLWCLHLYRYEGDVELDGQPIPILPGYLSVFPPGAEMQYKMRGLSTHIYAHFALPAGPETTSIAAMTDTGGEFGSFNEHLEAILGFFVTSPLRAEIRFWELLWQLAERRGQQTRSTSRDVHHPALDRAIQLLEIRLGAPVAIPALAREVGLSHNHLLRLFRARFGETIEGYIRQRRAARALHLLRRSTLPIKAVAAETGFPDQQAFNKAMRRHYGKPPSQLRSA